MRNPLVRSVLCLAATLAAVPGAWAQTLTFNKVVNTQTAVPGHDGNFVNIRDASSISNGVVVFAGVYVLDGKAEQGIYTGKADGSTPAVVVDFGSPVPGSDPAQTFDFVEMPVIGGSTILFDGTYPDTTQPPIQPGQYPGATGVFTATVGASGTTLLASGKTVTGAGENSQVAISGQNVIFSTGGGISTTVVGTVGGVSKVVDTRTVPPGATRAFTDLGNGALSGETVVFSGGVLGDSALYRAKAGQTGITTLLGGDTISPEGTPFVTFEDSAISGDTVAFTALFTGTAQRNEGIYTTSLAAPAPVLIADVHTLVPGLTGYHAGDTFTEFAHSPNIVGKTVVFQAFYPGGEGIFMSTDGVLKSIITAEDKLFGGDPQELDLGPTGYDGKDVTFRYALSNGEIGVAVVTVGGTGGTTGASAVSVAAVRTNVLADGSRGNGMFTVTRSGDLSAKAVVKYAVKGNAQPGVDYEKLSGKLKIKSGKASVTVEVVPLGKGNRGKRVVKLVILPGSGYTAGETPAAKIKLIPGK